MSSDSNGRYRVAYGESGYRLGLGRTQITPYINLQYAQIQRNGFKELGGYGFGLKSGAQTAERWQAGLGLRATHGWMLAGGGSLSLQTRLLWQQSFGMRGEVFDASFSGINQFASVGGIGLSRYGGVLGTTLDWSMTPSASLQFGYDQYLGQRAPNLPTPVPGQDLPAPRQTYAPVRQESSGCFAANAPEYAQNLELDRATFPWAREASHDPGRGKGQSSVVYAATFWPRRSGD